MARFTQYIGLTKGAQDWVKRATKVESCQVDIGITSEPVMGHIYHMPPPKGPNKALIAKEVVQFRRLSSGPMIFTHLQMTLVKEVGQEIDVGYYYSWTVDPTVEGEYDQEKGTLYV